MPTRRTSPRRLEPIALPAHEDLREPENGLVMVRGRIGGDGAPFNLGEATVSRAAVRLATGEVGFGYALGRDRRKAQADRAVRRHGAVGRTGAARSKPGRRAAARGDDRPSETARPRRRRRRGSISSRWCGVRADDDDALPNCPPDSRTRCLSAQSTFRAVMDAMARPGSVQRIAAAAGAPAAMMRGTAAIALTLFDHDTPIWLDAPLSATPDVAQMAPVSHRRAGHRGLVDRAALRWSRDAADAAGARPLRARHATNIRIVRRR